MDDTVFDCTDRLEDGKINIDAIYNGSITCDETNPEVEHGRPVSNPSVFTFLTNIYHGRKNARQPIPIPDRITKTLQHVKNALLVDPISYTEDGRMVGMDEYTGRWHSRVPQKVAQGKEITRMMPDRKGNRYKRKYYAAHSQEDMAGIEPLQLSHDMEPFEAAQFVNLYPESAEEAKALIPTMDRFQEKELHWYRDELKRFEINSARRSDHEPAHKRMKHISFKSRNVDSAMLDVVRAQRPLEAVDEEYAAY